MGIEKKSVLVTGAGGFIGSHLAERLVEEGCFVKALVRYNSLGSWGWLEQSKHKGDIEVVAGDICDRDFIEHVVKGVDIVFHLAALIAIPYSYSAPLSYVKTIVEGTVNVLQACRANDIERFVHTSTSEVYGAARYVPIDENHSLQGRSPYAAAKIGADKMVESFHLSFALPAVTVRPFNTFGPRQSARAVIPTIIIQCLEDNSIHLGNLSPTRDLNYVSNTIDGFIRAASVPQAVGRTINIGSGREISIGDLAKLIACLLGKSIEIESVEQRLRPGDSEVERLLADNSLARDILQWQPAVSLEDGLKHTIDWLAEHKDLYKPALYNV
jgi:NAD dependent epimerase/dehydratase